MSAGFRILLFGFHPIHNCFSFQYFSGSPDFNNKPSAKGFTCCRNLDRRFRMVACVTSSTLYKFKSPAGIPLDNFVPIRLNFSNVLLLLLLLV